MKTFTSSQVWVISSDNLCVVRERDWDGRDTFETSKAISIAKEKKSYYKNIDYKVIESTFTENFALVKKEIVFDTRKDF